jgi:hypothetical protein
MFLPAALIGDADVNETGQLTSAFRTAQQPKLDAALADMNTATIPAYLLHTDPTMTPDAITALTLLTTVGTQRRRLR